jgi:ubiquinone biosynthesis monooxygenase Coq7
VLHWQHTGMHNAAPIAPTLSTAPGPATATALASTGPAANEVADSPRCLTVLFDGACPLCRREIGVYRGLQAREPLRFVDVNAEGAALPGTLTRDALLARFHVQRADGRIDSGARAFIALWAALPGWRWLARLASLPGVPVVMEGAYRGFLRLRPRLQRIAAAFEPAAAHVPADMVGELRSDHAGETGAVWIYHGVLAVARDPALRAFARRHRATEQDHLRRIAPLLPWPQRSRLLLPWRVAGFLTGALPALFGPRAVYGTIAAVETFVDTHYQQQIDRLAGRAEAAPLLALLQSCQADELHHRDEAQAQAGAPGPLLRAWCSLVGRGSAAAVVVARRI